MIIGVILGILLFAAVIGIVYLLAKNAREMKLHGTSVTRPMLKVKSIILAVLAVAFIAVFLTVPFSVHTVNAGQIAVVKVWGRAMYTRTAGTYFDWWFSTEYVMYDLTVQQEDIKTMAYSSDAQTMDVELVVQYQIQPEKAVEIVNNYGSLNLLSNRINAISTEKAKTILSSKSAMSIIVTRASLSPSIEQLIKESVTDEYFVNIVTVVVTNIDFSDNFESTVEEKMIAEQEKLKAEYEKEKAIVEAERELEVAKLAAQATIAEASGKAEANLEIATAAAKAIQLKSIEIARMFGFAITEKTTDDGVEYTIDFTGKSKEEIAVISDYLKYVEYLNVWDGTLPTTYVTDDSASILVTP